MKENIYIRFLLLSAVILFVNLGMLYGFGWNVKIEAENVQLFKMIAFFLFTSLLMLLVHVYINKEKKDILGYAFLATLTIKMIFSYVFIASIKQSDVLSELEKICFFVLFVEFLFVDVFFTVTLLNKNNWN